MSQYSANRGRYRGEDAARSRREGDRGRSQRGGYDPERVDDRSRSSMYGPRNDQAYANAGGGMVGAAIARRATCAVAVRVDKSLAAGAAKEDVVAVGMLGYASATSTTISPASTAALARTLSPATWDRAACMTILASAV